MNFFGIGLPEMAVIAAIGLLVFGPRRLPELGKTLGRTLRGFQSASQEFEKEFRNAIREEEPSALPPEVLPTEALPAAPPAVRAERVAAGPAGAETIAAGEEGVATGTSGPEPTMQLIAEPTVEPAVAAVPPATTGGGADPA